MSASLVGSEMCIRDSNGAPQHVSMWACLIMCKEVVAEDTQWLERNAVSYTHLTLPTICSV
eukprot:8165624-Alexandrium_andersonii.AAC.1